MDLSCNGHRKEKNGLLLILGLVFDGPFKE
jgi:hypothetical protein